ncbi:ribosome-associated protein [Pseudoxanthomonas helianthi]|uniref:Dual-action ribosomal maturation protein DarP n=1 Tax=Pseudoxanthomonas helianthi TaxID=1453541 RepID=A0A941AUB2_9GAMM|nr:ribosome biogenesis factor YjgA [Pseudoxanthomonas helianthi]MBP3984899.1 ribosome-associated protein [Pseudoxanthomonas helianthi]
MRGRDPETGEFYSPSRTQQRVEALEVRSLAEKLVALPPAQLLRLPIPESLLPHIHETQRITSHIAHKRQLQYLAKQMRREDDEVLQAIHDALDEGGEMARREAAQLHQAERWRERLLDDGDAALAELLDEFPTADRQKLRQLVRNAHDERAKNKPPRAFRELFREVRALLLSSEDETPDGSEESDDET